MNPDEVMLRNARSGKDITPVWDMMAKPLTAEERAEAFRPRPSPPLRLPDPHLFISVGAPKSGRKGIEVTVGLKGTF